MVKSGHRPILAAILCLASAAGAHAADSANDVRLKSDEKYVQGHYVTVPSVWSRYLDPSLKDYDNRIHVRKDRFPDDTSIAWRFPDKYPVSGGVYGYNFVAYGQYWDAQPPEPIPARKLEDILDLTISIGISPAKGGGDYNILSEFFITRAPNDIGSRVAEVGWLLSAPQRTRDYLSAGKPIGAFTDRFGGKWVCASHNDGAAGLYITFMPADGKRRLRTDIDALASLKWLIARKAVDPASYFNGAAIGIEPVRGSGSAIIDRFSVTYR